MLKIFLLTFILALLITPFIKKLAWRLNIVDNPNPPLKNHILKTPMLGGIAVFLSILLATGALFFLSDFKIVKIPPSYQYGWGGYYVCPTFLNNNTRIFQGSVSANVYKKCFKTGIPIKYLIGILIGGMFLIIGGILDDKYNLKPKQQVIFPILAIISVVISGIAPHNISNPLYHLKLSSDPLFHLEFFKIKILTLNGVPYYLTLISDAITFFWLFLLIYTTKFLDGLDGLVPGISVISGIFLFIISLFFNQPLIAILCLIFSAAYLGFLPFNLCNWKIFDTLYKKIKTISPNLRRSVATERLCPFTQSFSKKVNKLHKSVKTKIFLGESGSTLAGYFLGILAILGEAKITATLLLLGIPIIDALWVIYRRLIKDKSSPFLGDRKHLHFRLLTKGLSPRKSVLLLWGLCFAFGLLGLFMQGILFAN